MLDTAFAGRLAARLLYRLLEVYTPTGLEAKAYPVVEEFAGEHGLHSYLDPEDNIVVEFGGEGEPLVLFASHVDTVEGFTPPRIEGNMVYGRGAVDAKGPLASMIAGLAIARSWGLACRAQVAALAGEEGDSRGAWSLARRGRVAPYVVIGEPTGGDGVAIGYRGSGKVVIECRGVEGHAASLNSSPLESLAEVIYRLSRMKEEMLPHGVKAVPTVARAGSSWNVVPSVATAVVDLRFESGVEGLRAAGEICRVAFEIGCGCRQAVHTGPARTRLSSPVPRALVRSLRSLGVKPRVTLKQGTSDMNILQWFSSSIAAYGPGDPRLAHTGREAVSMEDLGRAALVYARAMAELCGGLRPG